MTTIKLKGLHGGFIGISEAADQGRIFITGGPHGASIDRAKLLGALGAVPKGTPYAELAEQLHAATQRAEAAEAAIQRVRDLDWYGNYSADYVREKIGKALDPVPPFTLPTEAGAGIGCTGPTAGGLAYYTEMRLFSDGRWRDTEGCAWDADTVLDTFWDHRLLGAEDA